MFLISGLKIKGRSISRCEPRLDAAPEDLDNNGEPEMKNCAAFSYHQEQVEWYSSFESSKAKAEEII